MNIICIPSGPLQANSYVIYENKNEAIVIDVGGYSEIAKYLEQNDIVAKHILLTHGHFDHCSGAKDFQEKGCKIYVSKEDVEQIKKGLFASGFDIVYRPVEPDVYLDEGEIVLSGMSIKVINTPGHTDGGVCFLVGDSLFTGDTLFRRNIGRTDLFGGDSKKIKESLKKLFSIDGNYTVYPGHGDNTNLDAERSFFARWLEL